MHSTKAPNLRAAWAKRHKQIDRIHRIFDLLPMTDKDGNALARCLAMLMRGRDLTPDQEVTYQWWSNWLKAIDTTCLAMQIETALVQRQLPAVVRIELTNAQARLWAGKDMTSRQAGLWGAYIVSRRCA